MPVLKAWGFTYVGVRPQQDVLELCLLLVDVFDGLLGCVVGRRGLQHLRALDCRLAFALHHKCSSCSINMSSVALWTATGMRHLQTTDRNDLLLITKGGKEVAGPRSG